MPDQGDPLWGAEERFAEAVELGRSSGTPADSDAGLARDLEIAAMLRALGPSLSAGADAKARVRARVMAALAVDGPPSDGGGRAAAQPAAPDSTSTEQLPIIPPAEDAPSAPGPATARLDVAPVERRPATARLDATPGPTTARPDATPAPATAQLDVTRSTAAGPRDSGTSGAEPGATLVWQADQAVAQGADEPGSATALLSDAEVFRALRPGRRRRHALPSRPSGRPSAGAPSVRRRIMVVGAAALLAVIAVAGGGIFASRDALPGDPLYAIKRAAEAAGGIFAGGDASRAQRDLDLASTRLDEIERMVRDSADPALISSAIQDFDAATSAGTRLVLSGDDPGHTYADLSNWATTHSARMSRLRPALPASVQPAADDSLRLLDRVHRRATALSARSSCTEVTSGAVDDLGPLPATGPCVVRGSAGGSAPAASDPAARRASGSAGAPDSGAPSATPDQDGSSDPGLLPGVSVGTSPNNESGSTTTTQAPPSSKNVDVPLPLPVPITVPPLVPGKPGVTLG